MTEYGQALFLDVLTVLICTGLLVRFGDLRFSHPATPYIAFHLHTVTARLAGLVNGAQSLYSHAPGWFEPVVPAEIVRAALYCDIAYWSVTAVWILMTIGRRPQPVRTDAILLDPRILRPVLVAAFLGGLVGLRIAARVPGVSPYEGGGFDPSGMWLYSSYLIILPSWFGLAVLGYIYYYGFSRVPNVLLAVYLAIMSLQGGMRYRVIIAILLAVQIWVDRRNRRWPSRAIGIGLCAAAVLFFPMKQLGQMMQKGATFGEMSSAVTDSVSEVSDGAAPDHMFLDEFASALTLIDVQDKKYLGSIYLPLITLPIPRALWPGKPVLAGYLADISTSRRPMAVSGMITTYLGEAYANFGVIGIFLIPPLLALLLQMFHRRAYSSPRDSVLRFSYVLLSVNLIQVYRDGLVSIVVFTFVNMMPLVVIVIAHALSMVRKSRSMGPLRYPVPARAVDARGIIDSK